MKEVSIQLILCAEQNLRENFLTCWCRIQSVSRTAAIDLSSQSIANPY